jgi:uncharacterized protein YjbI with pentapeptide repeats
MARLPILVWVILTVLFPSALGADLTAEQVRQTVAAAGPGKPVDLSGESLENIDLSKVDFRRANLFGAKLDGTDFSSANLSGAKLDLAWIIRANFTNADLSNASLLGLVVPSELENRAAEAPIFKGARFAGAHIMARLSRFDFSGADFTSAKMAPDLRNQSMGLMRTDLSGANLSGANLSKADLGFALMRFTNLTGANVSGANLTGADLSGANLTGADLTGADATRADFGRAVLSDAKGLETVKGLRR